MRRVDEVGPLVPPRSVRDQAGSDAGLIFN